MAVYASVVQAGTTLNIVDSSGTVTVLSLPASVKVATGATPRFAIFGRYVVVVNSVDRPISIGPDGIIRPLTPMSPRFPGTLTGIAGGSLSGTYLTKQTFVIKDTSGNVIAESDFGSAQSTATTISSKYLGVSALDISSETVSGSRLYRTATSGSTYFNWIDTDSPTQTSAQDDSSDAALSLLAAPTLGTAPPLSLVAEFRERLFGVSKYDIDTLRWTEAGTMYAWGSTNTATVPRPGQDYRGVTALIARREALGVGRRDRFFQLTGTSNSDFRLVKLSENVGVESQESVQVYRDVAYFLWKDGVYQWDNNGIRCISDKKVRSWFTTDTYFNRSRFKFAFGMIDPLWNRYKLFLASAGSSSEDRWIEYDLEDGTWWGPHRCQVSGWTPTCAFVLPDSNELQVPVIGTSNGFLWKEQSTATDDTATGITINLDTKFLDGNTPDIDKYWGELSVIGKVQSGGTISITPKVGYLDASAGSTVSYTMSNGRQRLRRLGTGKTVQLNFAHSTAAEPVELYGLEIPFHELGRR